ncbi:unnamed protein product [Amoebophrya sp. A120]|nr:unnamed protein product [Amoebophrya sp. A120]|eukprot:GSA120T00000489001.1
MVRLLRGTSAAVASLLLVVVPVFLQHLSLPVVKAVQLRAASSSASAGAGSSASGLSAGRQSAAPGNRLRTSLRSRGGVVPGGNGDQAREVQIANGGRSRSQDQPAGGGHRQNGNQAAQFRPRAVQDGGDPPSCPYLWPIEKEVAEAKEAIRVCEARAAEWREECRSSVQSSGEIFVGGCVAGLSCLAAGACLGPGAAAAAGVAAPAVVGASSCAAFDAADAFLGVARMEQKAHACRRWLGILEADLARAKRQVRDYPYLGRLTEAGAVQERERQRSERRRAVIRSLRRNVPNN